MWGGGCVLRKAMQSCVRKLIINNQNSALLLVDIGAWPFHDLLEKYPDRAKNIGVFEPGTISLAAGLSLSGIIPTVYGISPFIAQRSLEQLKLDFVYQKIGGNFIVTGASYDFSTLGYSHYCPEDIATLKMLPGMEIVTPGSPEEFTALWNACKDNGRPTYYRMTDYSNSLSVLCEFGQATVLKKGTNCTVIAVAETLDKVWNVCRNEDVTLLYYNTIAPFDRKTLSENCDSGKVLVCTPFYEGSITDEVVNSLGGRSLRIEECGVPNVVLRNYGTKEEKDQFCGLTEENITNKLRTLI